MIPCSARLVAVLTVVVAASACVSMPPASSGWVDARPGKSGAFSASVHGGVVESLPNDYSTRGELHVDPRVSEESSVPLDASWSRSFDGIDVTRGLGRFGYRYRPDPEHVRAYLGFGAGPNFIRYEPSSDNLDIDPGEGWGFAADFEVGFGTRGEHWGISYTMRPAVTWNSRAYWAFWVPADAQGVWFFTPDLGLTAGLSLGVAFVFPDQRNGLGIDTSDVYPLSAGAMGAGTLGIAYSPR